jgi:hypothetical protein
LPRNRLVVSIGFCADTNVPQDSLDRTCPDRFRRLSNAIGYTIRVIHRGSAETTRPTAAVSRINRKWRTVNSTIVAALVGGGFALLATAVGAFLTRWLTGRTVKDQRAYDEILRQRERLLDEREKLLSPSNDEAIAMREMLFRGGELLPPRVHSNRFLYQSNWSMSHDFQAGCFPRGTLVLMAEGSYDPIEELKEGDLIKTYNVETHTESQSAINEVVTAAGKQLVRINNMTTATPEQQILCDGQFRPAASLLMGGVLVSDRHQPVVVTSVELVPIDEEVLSLALNEDAGYFIRSPQAEYSILVREARTGKI